MPGPPPAAGVRGRALLGDRLEVEQVGGRLRDQPDEGAAPGGVEPGRVGARRRRPCRSGASCGALERPDQRRLARAVAAHQRGDLARAQLEVDVAHGHVLAVADRERRAASSRIAAAGAPARSAGARQVPQRPGAAPGVAHGQRQRRPAGQRGPAR